ncbi:hypothetical protein CYMTET_24234 [Cymbomonas tetramitiformis]|uniref:FHA domain-containing protein n=1 Tax=Cymbomonas tetramitiformis TaxID=36881 RepID=A0AAE0L057_9CHLO|nr:hypothetical protein CYMTET_24234 [Cymbomonas tetramitiformis]
MSETDNPVVDSSSSTCGLNMGDGVMESTLDKNVEKAAVDEIDEKPLKLDSAGSSNPSLLAEIMPPPASRSMGPPPSKLMGPPEARSMGPPAPRPMAPPAARKSQQPVMSSSQQSSLKQFPDTEAMPPPPAKKCQLSKGDDPVSAEFDEKALLCSKDGDLAKSGGDRLDEAPDADIKPSKKVPQRSERKVLPKKPRDAPPIDRPEYSQPEWSGTPVPPYHLEILRQGSIIGNVDLTGKPFFTLGRAPTCDVVLEHPSSSRLHAVIQFRSEDSLAFLYDCGSTHGSFVNKHQLKPQMYTPVHIGDVLKFGNSTRMYLFGGPQELIPEKGLSQSDRRHLAQLHSKAKEEQGEEEIRAQQMAAAQMAAALSDGCGWGQAEDAEQEHMVLGEAFDHRNYTGSLTEKQEKLKEKITKREWKMKNMQTEIDRINAKQDQEGGLSSGQQLAVSRNQQHIEQVQEEVEQLDDQLNESIEESILGKKKKTEKPKKKKPVEEEEDDDGSDDDFYDRSNKAKQRKEKKSKTRKQEVETVQSLWTKRVAVEEEQAALEEELKVEELKEASAGARPAPAAVESDDPLDAFMTGLSTEIEKDTCKILRTRLDLLRAELDRVNALIKIADPYGNYKHKPKKPDPAQEETLLDADMEEAEEPEPQRRRAASSVPALAAYTLTSYPKVRRKAPAAAVTPSAHVSPPALEDGAATPSSAAAASSTPAADGAKGPGKEPAGPCVGEPEPEPPAPAETEEATAELAAVAETRKEQSDSIEEPPGSALLEDTQEADEEAAEAGAEAVGEKRLSRREFKKQEKRRRKERKEAEAKAKHAEDGFLKREQLLLMHEQQRKRALVQAARSAAEAGGHVTPVGQPETVSEAQGQVDREIALLLAGSTGAQGVTQLELEESGTAMEGVSSELEPPSMAPGDEKAVWVAPAGQTGDGRTHLNDKYGY